MSIISKVLFSTFTFILVNQNLALAGKAKSRIRYPPMGTYGSYSPICGMHLEWVVKGKSFVSEQIENPSHDGGCAVSGQLDDFELDIDGDFKTYYEDGSRFGHISVLPDRNFILFVYSRSGKLIKKFKFHRIY